MPPLEGVLVAQLFGGGLYRVCEGCIRLRTLYSCFDAFARNAFWSVVCKLGYQSALIRAGGREQLVLAIAAGHARTVAARHLEWLAI